MNKKVALYVVAALVGILAAWLLFPAAPKTDIPNGISKPRAQQDQAAADDEEDDGDRKKRPKKRKNAKDRVAAAAKGDDKMHRGGEKKEGWQAPPPDEWRASPMGEHAAIDSSRWTHTSQVLAEAGEEELATEARELARELARAQRGADSIDQDDFLARERDLLDRIKASGAASELTNEIGMLEMGLKAAETGTPHPYSKYHTEETPPADAPQDNAGGEEPAPE